MTGTRRAKIRKGDQVIVLSGRDKTKRGRVLEVIPAKNKVKVEGIAVVKKHTKANQAGRDGGIIDQEAFIHLSNVALIDPDSGKASRVKYNVADDGTKTRVAVGSGKTITQASK